MHDINRVRNKIIQLTKNDAIFAKQYLSKMENEWGFIWFIFAECHPNSSALIFSKPWSFAPIFLLPFFKEVVVYEENKFIRRVLKEVFSDLNLAIRIIDKDVLLNTQRTFDNTFGFFAIENDINTCRSLSLAEITSLKNRLISQGAQFLIASESRTSLALWKEHVFSQSGGSFSTRMSRVKSLISLPTINISLKCFSSNTQQKKTSVFHFLPSLSRPNSLAQADDNETSNKLFSRTMPRSLDLTFKNEAFLTTTLTSKSFIKGIIQKLCDNLCGNKAKNHLFINNFFLRETGTLVMMLGEHEETEYVMRIPLHNASHSRLEKAWLFISKCGNKQERLRQWLPKPILKSEYHSYVFYVETFIHGEQIGLLDDRLKESMQSNVLKIINELGEINSKKTVITESLYQSLVGKKIDQIAATIDGCAPALDKLMIILKHRLIGFDANISFSHGDLNPGNIICDRSSGEIAGIIDWDSYEEETFALVDLIHFILCKIKRDKNIEIGRAVIYVLENGIENDEYRNLLEIFVKKLGLDMENLDTFFMTYWVNHIFLHCSKESHHLASAWVKRNVIFPLEKIINKYENYAC